MRLAIPLLLAATAVSSRAGCGGNGTRYDPCEGRACGAVCHLCAPDQPSCAEPAVVMACDADGKCVPAGSGLACFDPCAGKACGDVCDPCAPGLPCPMSPVAYRCDGARRCLLPDRGTTCDACAGKACGAQCTVDPPCYPLCLMPSLLGECDGKGFCVPVHGTPCPVVP
jgi:hypothetical protein